MPCGFLLVDAVWDMCGILWDKRFRRILLALATRRSVIPFKQSWSIGQGLLGLTPAIGIQSTLAFSALTQC